MTHVEPRFISALVSRRLRQSHGQLSRSFAESNRTLALAELPVHQGWIGHKSSKLGFDSGARIGFINRFGDALMPNKETVIQEGDIVHAIFKLTEQDSVMKVFSSAPEH
jgi:trk system potassium uptake protein TrkA